MAWLNFTELAKAVVRVIRLTSFLLLWFVCLPSDASHNTYHLTWVSLTLDVGYLFTAAPAKCSFCSLPWMRGISSLLPLLTLNVQGAVAAQCKRAKRSYSTFKVRRGGHEEIPLIQGKEQRLRFAGAAVKRYPKSKVRETQVRR